jgi:outer membrane scaffolding protein for murein synthesis (MipA/OmpV family)
MKSFRKSTIVLFAMLFAALASGESLAADGPQVVVSVGEGSRHYDAVPLLFLHAGWANGRFFAFKGAGLAANVIKNAKWQMGPVVRYRFSRDDVENRRVDMLRSVDESVEVGAFAGLSVGPWGTKLTVAQDVAGGHGGALAELEGSYGLPFGQKSSLAFSLSTTFADSDYMDAYFSVDPDNARRSGLSPFQADAGLKDVGVGMLYSRALQGSWGLNGTFRYSRLLGDAADSPLVAEEGDADQIFFGLMTNYRF